MSDEEKLRADYVEEIYGLVRMEADTREAMDRASNLCHALIQPMTNWKLRYAERVFWTSVGAVLICFAAYLWSLS